MAIDNTPPRLRLIGTIAVLTIVTLVALDFMLRSYFGYMTDAAIRSKLAPPIELEEQRKEEAKSLTAAKIDQAMAQVAKAGARPDSITPQQSDDTSAMAGWTKLPKAIPTAPSGMTPPAAPVGDGGIAGDGGPNATDAGAGSTPNAKMDGGALGAGGDAGQLGAQHPNH
jgi:hypothetical protein